jgi:hypothetical protein
MKGGQAAVDRRTKGGIMSLVSQACYCADVSRFTAQYPEA